MDGVRISLRDLNVQSMDTCCGVFIGCNQANCWESCSKENSGLGSGGETVSQNLNVVVDCDLVDVPIDDRDQMLIIKGGGLPLPGGLCMVICNAVAVNAMDTNATVTIGDNQQSGWSAHSKTNNGLGNANGKTVEFLNCSIVEDRDLIDAPIDDRDIKPTVIFNQSDG